jgi:MFS superfamily sulfate permease-like transporter
MLELSGVLWFGSAHQLEAAFDRLLETHRGVSSLVIDASALGRVDLSGSLLLAELTDRAHGRGVEAEIWGLEPHVQRVLGRVRQG